MIWAIASLIGAWMIGVSASIGRMSKIGEINPNTIGDCFSGDYTLDLVFALLWPISWPCYLAYRLFK